MRRITIFLLTALCCWLMAGTADAASRPKKKKAKKARVTRKHVVKKPVVLSVHDADPWKTCEDTCEHVHGIDVSHYQNDVFWKAVGEETNMAYVYLKASEGNDRVDALYARNIELAHLHGLKVGSYHFFRPKVNLKEQLENFKSQCLPGEQDLIPMLDVETMGDLTTGAFCDSLTKFLGMMEEAYHQKPIVYTYRNFYNKNLVGRLDNYQLWIAMYADEQPVLADERDYTMWQYTCKGRIKGVKGEVDKNRLMNGHRLFDIRYKH